MKKKVLTLLIFNFIMFPIFVGASDSTISIKCGKTNLGAGNSTDCVVSGKSSSNVTAISATLKGSENISFESFKPGSKWQGDDISNGKIDVYTADDISRDFEIGTLRIKVKDGVYNINDSIGLNNVLYYDSSYSSYSVDSTTLSIRIINNDSKLKKLSIEGIELSPKFSSDTFKYTATVSSGSINVIAESNDSMAKISGNGIVSLKNGINNIEVVVEAEDGSKTTYSIEVDAKLSDDSDSKDFITSSTINEDNNIVSSNDKVNNPKTGQSYIIYVIILLALSSMGVIYFKGKKRG